MLLLVLPKYVGPFGHVGHVGHIGVLPMRDMSWQAGESQNLFTVSCRMNSIMQTVWGEFNLTLERDRERERESVYCLSTKNYNLFERKRNLQ